MLNVPSTTRTVYVKCETKDLVETIRAQNTYLYTIVGIRISRTETVEHTVAVKRISTSDSVVVILTALVVVSCKEISQVKLSFRLDGSKNIDSFYKTFFRKYISSRWSVNFAWENSDYFNFYRDIL